MRVLAIDTALAACAAAVLDTEQGDIVAGESSPMVRGHAEALLPLIARLVERAGVSLLELDRVAVTTGPGSFTGLRVGLAAARGIALAANVPAVGISTLLAYAAPYLEEDDAARVIAAIDARHQHVYLQVFGAGGRNLGPPRFAPLSEAARVAAEVPAHIVGSAAQAVVDALGSGSATPLNVDGRNAPDIAWVARLGAVTAPEQAPPEPQYLRAPDAQPQNAAQLPRR
jgi:tRNA threonylcarbamoyladenosine biosynthesis protein TsaB